MAIVEAFYNGTNIDGIQPHDTIEINTTNRKCIFRPVKLNKVLLNKRALTLSETFPNTCDSVYKIYSGIVYLDTIKYGKFNYSEVKGGPMLEKCDGSAFHDNFSFFELESFSEVEMQGSLGVIVFSSNSAMKAFQNEVKLLQSCYWELPSDVPQIEEITRRLVLTISLKANVIVLILNGARNNSMDVEYLYSNIIDVKYGNKIKRIGYLSNHQCMEGGYIGF